MSAGKTNGTTGNGTTGNGTNGEPSEPPQRVSVPFDAAPGGSERVGMDRESFEAAVLDHVRYTRGKDVQSAGAEDLYWGLALAVRDRLLRRWLDTRRAYQKARAKRVYYLSAEYLPGRALGHNLLNLGLYDAAEQVTRAYGIDLSEAIDRELEPGLGNGGLGRLAACFLDSMATLGIPAFGYGIRYDYGIFEQELVDGWQHERRDAWLQFGHPWEIPRHELMQTVRFYGRLEKLRDETGKVDTRWVDTHKVVGLPFDVPISGYGTHTVNTLRLWSARATEEFDLAVFNDGDFRRAVEDKVLSESISKVLYPNDQSPEGKELRLKQQYFFVACSIADVMRRFKRVHDDMRKLPDHAAIHLNDTHPSIAVAELMRVLLDDEQLPWEVAWDITQRCTAYTNHTLLPEALERWPVAMFEHLLPRHMAIIYQINSLFLDAVHIFAPDEPELQRELSLIEEGHEKQVRMGHLAVVGSHSINGVAKLHSELIKRDLMKGFARLWPERFNNKTNGVTPRRWLLHANPRLAALISSRISVDWTRDLDRLRELNGHVQDEGLLEELGEIKRHNKTLLATIIHETTGERVDSRALFIAHVKRIHEYKRQLLTCLQIIALYRRIKDHPNAEFAPRVFILAGKAAPGYAMAKLHIKLLNDVARLISKDPTVRGRLKTVFLPNYRVSLAERIIPASDLSLQVSLAGMEASGTSNMKFAMNGGLTMGTLDGANIEILEQVGEPHFFRFGLTAEEVAVLRAERYHPARYLAQSDELRGAVEAIEHGLSSRSDRERFGSITYGLRHYDHYLTCADFDGFMAVHDHAVERFADQKGWQASALVNIANVGPFSSDRTVRQYAEEIWKVDPVSMKGVDVWNRSPTLPPR